MSCSPRVQKEGVGPKNRQCEAALERGGHRRPRGAVILGAGRQDRERTRAPTCACAPSRGREGMRMRGPGSGPGPTHAQRIPSIRRPAGEQRRLHSTDPSPRYDYNEMQGLQTEPRSPAPLPPRRENPPPSRPRTEPALQRSRIVARKPRLPTRPLDKMRIRAPQHTDRVKPK